MDSEKVMQTILTGVAIASVAVSVACAREVVPLDGDWRFLKGDVSGAEQPGYDDTQWKQICVPHDWGIEGPFAETNGAGGAGAFLPGGVGWYRKHFSLLNNDLSQRVFVEFDGVMPDCDAWINGMHLGHHTNGCAGFRYELPGSVLSFGRGTTNILIVCVDTTAEPASRGYVGAGIYRSARVLVMDQVHLAADGVRVSTPKISTAAATVQIDTTVTNEFLAPCEISVQTSLLAPDGETVGAVESSQIINAAAATTLEQQIAFPKPQLWKLAEPNLYRAISKVRTDETVADEQTTTFAIREPHFAADTDLWPSGNNFKLKGVYLNADGGAFGAAVPLSIWEGRLKTLKLLGVNAVCTAPYPPTLEFQDLCDLLGLLVMDCDAASSQDQFLWTGVDYLGESPGWPLVGQDSGLLDRTGALRPLARELQSRWSGEPMVAMARRLSPVGAIPAGPDSGGEAHPAQDLFSDWTPKDLKPHVENVEVYSNCKRVELFLNGKSLGKKEINADASPRRWQVPFAPGILRAVARGDTGRFAITNELRTAGKPVRIVLKTETTSLSPDWNDVAVVRATIVDSRGVTIPRASDLVSFKLSGPGVIAAVDNADNASHEPFQANWRHAFQGGCVAFVKANAAPGKITLTAAAAGLKAGSIVIRTW
jgi:hypothetical protein